ncbi:MAG: hypothetical protein CMO82_01385 [Winogradskyella sp.]|nr:hypothetical protein [Winogradskyella sp.]|tara:strand:+ start:316 stop:717 length:402 start_codon:yes stop_codon:yes gene_type:complete
MNEQSKELELNDRIAELEKMNKKLSDSLNKMMENRIYNTQLIAIPEKTEVTMGVPNKLNIVMHTFLPYPNYKVYRMKGNNEKEILKENLTKPSFDLEFIPRANEKTIVNYSVVIDFNGKKIEIPSQVSYEPEK